MAGVTETAIATETIERDSSPGAGASRRRIDEQPKEIRQTESDDGEAVSVGAKLSLLRQLYGARIEIARRHIPRRDRAAAIKALRLELKVAILAVTERARRERAARREAVRLRKPPTADLN